MSVGGGGTTDIRNHPYAGLTKQRFRDGRRRGEARALEANLGGGIVLFFLEVSFTSSSMEREVRERKEERVETEKRLVTLT